MIRPIPRSLALAATVLISACESPQQSAVSGGSAGGTLAGATSGAMIGASATPQPTYAGGPATRGCARWANDYNGNRICTAFY